LAAAATSFRASNHKPYHHCLLKAYQFFRNSATFVIRFSPYSGSLPSDNVATLEPFPTTDGPPARRPSQARLAANRHRQRRLQTEVIIDAPTSVCRRNANPPHKMKNQTNISL